MVTLVEGTPVRVAFKYRLHPVLHPRGTIQLYADWPGVMLSSLLGLPRVRVHRFKNGSIAVMRPGSADQFIAREILLWNIYRIRDSEIKEDDVVLDVGAHIGLFTLFVHRLVPKGRILAIEPDPDNFHMLKENIARN